MTDDSSLWQRMRARLFGETEPTLRDQIEDAIDEADEEGDTPPKGDLSHVERQMLRNLLQFGQQTVGDVAVPRSDIVAVPDTISFKDLVAAFAEAEHSRLPVYKDSLDHMVGMIHIKDVFELLANGKKPPPSIAGLIRAPLRAALHGRVRSLGRNAEHAHAFGHCYR
jgi:magnesium and cobalt transporter